MRLLNNIYLLLVFIVVNINALIMTVYGTAINASKAAGACALLYVIVRLCMWGLTL